MAPKNAKTKPTLRKLSSRTMDPPIGLLPGILLRRRLLSRRNVVTFVGLFWEPNHAWRVKTA
jgi:hypothetical protein